MFKYCKSQNPDRGYELVDIDTGEVIAVHESVAICYSRNVDKLCIIMKHGSEEKVNEWMNNSAAKYRKAGLGDLVKELKVISARHWNVDVLNKFINTSGYFDYWIKKMNALLGIEIGEPHV